MRSGSALLGAPLEGRYRIDSTIARGGMSTVYRGVDLRLDRPVAIKVMDPRFADDPAFLSRFELEARSVARLSHAGLVAVYDQGSDDGHVFLVMELVEGGTLRALLRERGALPVPVAFGVLEPVLAALATAHRVGLVHRDVKPENVLIAADGTVKIADFGLVRAVAAAGVTAGSVILGTAAYLSPEQVTPGRSDARSDVYSAGVLLYEMLSGAPPYSGDTALAVAYQHVNTDTTAPSRCVPGLAPELDDLVLRATRRDPDARFRDAGEMLTEVLELRRWLHLPTVRVPVPQDPTRAGRDGGAETVLSHHTRALSTELFARSPGPLPHRPGAARDFAGARRRARRSAVVWITVVLLLAGAVGAGGWWLGSGRFTAVPALTGLPSSTAEQLLAHAHLKAAEITGYDNTAPPQQVLGAAPVAGSKVARGSTVKLTVSLGPAPVAVPAVRGRTVADATAALADAGLQVGATTDVFSPTAPGGAVVDALPPAGTTVRKGSVVALQVSTAVTVPSLRGHTVATARSQLAKLGLQVTVRQLLPFDGSLVLGQDISAGTRVRAGSAVVLTAVP